jgi:hypothetical protein
MKPAQQTERPPAHPAFGSRSKLTPCAGAGTPRVARKKTAAVRRAGIHWHGPGGKRELLQADADGTFKILTAGSAFEASIGRPARDLNVAELAIDRARALRELHEQAVAEGRPVHTVVYGVVDGLVCVYDLVAIPLSHRRELSLCLVYIQERERNFSLVEAMFQATKDRLLALAVIRDVAGAPVDFQIPLGMKAPP